MTTTSTTVMSARSTAMTGTASLTSSTSTSTTTISLRRRDLNAHQLHRELHHLRLTLGDCGLARVRKLDLAGNRVEGDGRVVGRWLREVAGGAGESLDSMAVAVLHLEALVLAGNRLEGVGGLLDGQDKVDKQHDENDSAERESTQHIAPLRRELALPLASLTHLDLSRNSIGGALPDTMPRHLPALQILKLAGNLITALPSTIGDWRRLRVLVCGSECMGGNQLCVLPAGIGRLIALEELDVSHNQLVALPVTIGDLRSLRVLTVYGNRLRQLPSSISRLRSMRSLNIAKNEIELLPEAMAEMPATLEMVDLSNNQLQVLSVELAEFLRARTVLLAGNPFDMKRATVAGPLSSSSSSTCSSSVMHATERVPHYVPMPPMTTTTSNVSTTTDYDCAYPPLVAPTFAASPVASLLELSARSVIANRHLALPNPATIHRIPDRLIRLLCVRGGQCFLCQRVYLAEYRTHVEPKDYLGHCEVPQQVTLCSESCLRKCRSSSSSLDALSTAVPRCDIMAAPAGSASDSDESAEERAAMTPVQLATRLAHLGRHHGQRKHGHKKSKMWKWLDRIEHFQLQQQHEGLRQLQDGSVVMDDLQHPHDMVNDW